MTTESEQPEKTGVLDARGIDICVGDVVLPKWRCRVGAEFQEVVKTEDGFILRAVGFCGGIDDDIIHAQGPLVPSMDNGELLIVANRRDDKELLNGIYWVTEVFASTVVKYVSLLRKIGYDKDGNLVGTPPKSITDEIGGHLSAWQGGFGDYIWHKDEIQNESQVIKE